MAGDLIVTWPDELVELYEASYRQHVGLAYTILGSRAEAEEVVQDAFVSALQHWAEVMHPSSYVRRAVVNGSIAVLRRRETAEGQPVDPAPLGEPEQLVELRDSLLALPEKQRIAIVLRYLADQTTQDIAQNLSCREGTVRSLISRGLASLRREVPQ